MAKKSVLSFAAGLAAALLGCSDQLTWQEARTLVHDSFPEVPQLEGEALAAWLEDPERQPPILLDVRAPAEFEVSHLGGARRAEPGGGDIDRVLDGVAKDQPIVAYCSVGYRSSELARKLMERGFSEVYNLDGSIFEWANEGRPLVQDGAPVREVHPYDEEWGALLDRELHRYEVRR